MSKKNHEHIIFDNTDYSEWYDAMLEDGYDKDELSYEYYDSCKEQDLGDERMNLDVVINGVIIAYAVLGLWDGKKIATKTFGSNIKNILKSSCEYVKWYCDDKNVRCRATHHDGVNHYLYRIANSSEHAEKLMDDIIKGKIDCETDFIRRTRPLRPFIANVYGW